MNELGAADPQYVRARRALLDALDALGPHRKAMILVGAQAIYLHVGEAREALSSFTIDADLAIKPAELSDKPALEAALAKAGFSRRDQPGLWFTNDGVEVDLLVPAGVAGKRGRSADLGPNHERMAARQVDGLEAVLVDSTLMRIAALEPSDTREHTIAVAGPAALLIAKLHKIGERSSQTRPDRAKNKDASDLFLLLRETETAALSGTTRWLRDEPISAEVTKTALHYLSELFTTSDGRGMEMLREAVTGPEYVETIAQSCIVLAQDLLDAVG